MKSKIQIVPLRVEQKQQEMEEELLDKMGVRPNLILCRLKRYILSQKIIREEYKNKRTPIDKNALDYNYVPLSVDWIVSEGFTSGYSANRDKRKAARKYLATLEKYNVIYLLDDGGYMLNPLYYYAGRRYLDAYEEWLNLTGEKPTQAYMRHSEKEWNNLMNRWEFTV